VRSRGHGSVVEPLPGITPKKKGCDFKITVSIKFKGKKKVEVLRNYLLLTSGLYPKGHTCSCGQLHTTYP
jgi:hypothetical protein